MPRAGISEARRGLDTAPELFPSGMGRSRGFVGSPEGAAQGQGSGEPASGLADPSWLRAFAAGDRGPGPAGRACGPFGRGADEAAAKVEGVASGPVPVAVLRTGRLGRGRLSGAGLRRDDGQGARQDRRLVAHPLQCRLAGAGLRPFPDHPRQGQGETFRQFPVLAGDFVLADRGYSTAPGIAHVAACDGHVTVRVNTGSLGFVTRDGSPFDLGTALSSLDRPGGSWTVATAAAGPVEGRVGAIRKSEEAIRQAHDRREAGNKAPKAETLYASYVILFSTFPDDRFDADAVLQWYRLRWQEELVFKRFKSLVGLGHLPKHDSAEAWLYGKLLTALLAENHPSGPRRFPLGVRHHDTAVAPGASSPWFTTRSSGRSSRPCPSPTCSPNGKRCHKDWPTRQKAAVRTVLSRQDIARKTSWRLWGTPPSSTVSLTAHP